MLSCESKSRHLKLTDGDKERQRGDSKEKSKEIVNDDQEQNQVSNTVRDVEVMSDMPAGPCVPDHTGRAGDV